MEIIKLAGDNLCVGEGWKSLLIQSLNKTVISRSRKYLIDLNQPIITEGVYTSVRDIKRFTAYWFKPTKDALNNFVDYVNDLNANTISLQSKDFDSLEEIVNVINDIYSIVKEDTRYDVNEIIQKYKYSGLNFNKIIQDKNALIQLKLKYGEYFYKFDDDSVTINDIK